MRRRLSSGFILLCILVSITTFSFHVRKSYGTIYINSDGSIQPVTANITTADNITYFFTGDIHDSVVVLRGDIIIDGAGRTLQGSGSGKGLWLDNEKNNITVRNLQIENFRYGIFSQNCHRLAIYNNTIISCSEGIYQAPGYFNSITQNVIMNCRKYGIYLHYPSHGSTLTDNIFLHNEKAIVLHWTSNMTLKGNVMTSNNYSLVVDGEPLNEFLHDIDTSNTVDGKPVYYWVNKHSQQMPADAGYIGVVNSTSITVKDMNMANNGQGILLAHTTHSTISNNTLTENENGILMVYSPNNMITTNTMTKNVHGITLMWSHQNNITDNKISENRDKGIALYYSSNNCNLSRNIVSNNSLGIYFHFVGGVYMVENMLDYNRYSFGLFAQYQWNLIHQIDTSNLVNGKPIYYYINQKDLVINPETHPDIGLLALVNSTNITVQNLTLLDSFNGLILSFTNNSLIVGNTIMNSWFGIYNLLSFNNTFYHNNFIDFEQLIYDNYWALNTYDDGCEGNYYSNYDGVDSDGDGVGDTPLIIDSNNQDNYPLMNPYWNPADINHDLVVDIYDVVTVCLAYDSTSSDLHWNCHCDIAEQFGVIDIFDVVLLTQSYGEEYTP